MKENDLTAISEHEPFMRRCIELAKLAQQKNNTPVGSLIVIDGEIVGEGVEGLPAGSDVTAHAEVIACRQAVDICKTLGISRTTFYRYLAMKD